MRTLDGFIGAAAALIAMFLLFQPSSASVINALAAGTGKIVASLQGRG